MKTWSMQNHPIWLNRLYTINVKPSGGVTLTPVELDNRDIQSSGEVAFIPMYVMNGTRGMKLNFIWKHGKLTIQGSAHIGCTQAGKFKDMCATYRARFSYRNDTFYLSFCDDLNQEQIELELDT